MNWALEHFQIVLAIAVAIAAWLKKARDDSARRSANPTRPTLKETTSSRNPQLDTEATERTRQIQAEIRRKIEERARRVQTPSSTSTLPPALPAGQYDPFSPEALQRRAPAEMPRPPETPRVASALEVNRKLEAAKRRALRKKENAAVHADSISIQVAPIDLIPSAGALLPVHPLREVLNDPEDVRRAIVLSEILRPPVALRDH